MAYRVVTTPRAEHDIAEAFTYIAERAPQSAVRWYKRLKGEIELLADSPARCPVAPETERLGIETRQMLFGKRTGIYRVVFRIVEERKEVHVITVRHGARRPLESKDLY